MNMEKKKKFDGTEVEVVGADYEEGIPEGSYQWRSKMRNREEMLKFIKTSGRYFYDPEPFGSEKRKNPA